MFDIVHILLAVLCSGISLIVVGIIYDKDYLALIGIFALIPSFILLVFFTAVYVITTAFCLVMDCNV